MTLPCPSVCEKPWYTTLTKSYVPIGCGDESVPLTTCRSHARDISVCQVCCTNKGAIHSVEYFSVFTGRGTWCASLKLGHLTHNLRQCDADGYSQVAP